MELNPVQMDALKELTNIGGGNAATALSKFIGTPVHMEVPVVRFSDYEDLYSTYKEAEEEVVAVSMHSLGDADGIFLLVTNREGAERMIRYITKEAVSVDAPLGRSAIEETVNIIVSSYLNALSMMLGMNIISSVPVLVQDMFGAILSTAYIEAGIYDETLLIIENNYWIENMKIESMLFFIPAPGELEKMFAGLGIE